MLRFEESLVFLEEALKRNPDSINTLINKAESLYQLKRFDEALETADKVLKKEPRNLNALKIVAYSYYGKLVFPEAEPKFREIYQIEPTDFDTVRVMMQLLSENNKYDEETLEFCNDALKHHPKNVTILLFRSHVFIRLNHPAKAIEDCDLVIELDKSQAAAYYNKGCAKALLSEGEEAIQLIKMAISLDSKFKDRAKSDKDLDTLRDKPEFRKMLT
jgi:tetratricopeptide (TPR) repeat protein